MISYSLRHARAQKPQEFHLSRIHLVLNLTKEKDHFMISEWSRKRAIAVLTVEPASKVYFGMQTRLMSQ